MLSRSVALNVLGQAVSLGLGFVASIVLARWLGPTDRGLLAIMLSVVAVTYIVVSVGLPLSVEYHVSRRGVDPGAVLGNTLLWGSLIAAVVVPAFWALRHGLADHLAHGRGGNAWILVGALIPLTFVGWTSANQLSGMLRFGLYNALFAASRILYVATVIVLLTAMALGVTSGLIAAAASTGVLIAGSLAAIARRSRPRLDRELLGRMLRYGARNEVGQIFDTLNYRLDVVILQFFRPLSQVGYYVVAQVIAEIAIAFAISFQGVVPLVSGEEAEERRQATTVSSIHHHAILAVAALLGTAALGPVVISQAFGHEFDRSIAPMLLLLPGIWFLGTGRVCAQNLDGRGRPGVSSLLAGAATFVTIALDLALVPWLGIYGAVIASICAYTTYGAGGLVVLSRISAIPLRTLLVPTRADLRIYPATAVRLLAAVRRV
jgi:stage V sporulation protein B